MTRISSLVLAGLTTLFVGLAAPTADAQGGFLHVGRGGFSVGVRTDGGAFGFGTGQRRWGGHRSTYHRRVWHDGYWERRWVPARYVWRREPCGRRYRTFQRGYHRNVWHRGRRDHVRERRRTYCAGGRCRH